MFQDPTNHSLGTQECVQGYEFHFSHPDEWTIVAEVHTSYYTLLTTLLIADCRVILNYILSGALCATDLSSLLSSRPLTSAVSWWGELSSAPSQTDLAGSR